MSLQVSLLRQSFERACPTEQEQHLFAEQFYQTLFATHPELQPLFAHTSMQEQTRKLMATLMFVLQTLPRPDQLLPSLHRLGQHHRNMGVKAEQYPMVEEALLATLAARLGSQWTAELHAAWTEAYKTIATLMQEEEGGVREEPVETQ